MTKDDIMEALAVLARGFITHDRVDQLAEELARTIKDVKDAKAAAKAKAATKKDN